jgi:outer membrane protein TolC
MIAVLMKKVLLLIAGLALMTGILPAQVKNLDYYVEQALNNSPLLNDYRNQVQTNLLDSERIRATYKPQVTGTSTNSYAPVIKGFGYDNAITNGGQGSALVGVSQALVSRRNLTAQFETLRLQNRGIENSASTSEQDLKRTVIAQYITAYGDLQQLNVTREITEMLRTEDTLL